MRQNGSFVRFAVLPGWRVETSSNVDSSSTIRALTLVIRTVQTHPGKRLRWFFRASNFSKGEKVSGVFGSEADALMANLGDTELFGKAAGRSRIVSSVARELIDVPKFTFRNLQHIVNRFTANRIWGAASFSSKRVDIVPTTVYLEAPTRTQDLLTLKWLLKSSGCIVASTRHDELMPAINGFPKSLELAAAARDEIVRQCSWSFAVRKRRFLLNWRSWLDSPQPAN
jgi:hypothetical protein